MTTETKPNKARQWLTVVLICAATVGVLGFVKFSQISSAIAFAESFPEPSETVTAAAAEETVFVPRARVVGEVVPLRSVLISNELAGSIVQVGFEPGASVAAGQLLLQLDISEEQALLAAARARVALAERTLARNESLVNRSAASQQAQDTALADRDVALAETARIQAVIDKKTLRAPFDARAGLERWEVSGYLPAATPVTTLVGRGPEVWVDFSLPQQDAELADGDPVRIQAEGNRMLQARVIARSPGVDPASRSVTYRAAVEDQRLASLPGAIVSVWVAVGPPQPALAVPAVALRQDTFGRHVFTLAEAEPAADARYRAVRRPVRLLHREAETAYLALDLKPGEQVVADGAFKLRDGILVNLDDRRRIAADAPASGPEAGRQ